MKLIIDIPEVFYEYCKAQEDAIEIQLAVKNGYIVEEEPKTGHWIDEFGGCECSECGCLEVAHSDYCPNCGAKMIEPQESEGKE